MVNRKVIHQNKNKDFKKKSFINNILQIAEWDSKFFGFRVARLSGSNLTKKVLDECIKKAKKEKISCIYCLAKPEYKEILEQAGFFFIDEKVELVQKNIDSSNFDKIEIEEAKHEDIPKIKKIASKEFRGMTRFYRDTHFDKKKVDMLYKLWVDKLMNDPDSTILIIRKGEDIVAFNGISNKNGEGRIELIAVDSKYKNKGYGEKIINHAQKYFNEIYREKLNKKIDEIKVNVYKKDTNLINELQKLGFKIKVKVVTQKKKYTSKEIIY